MITEMTAGRSMRLRVLRSLIVEHGGSVPELSDEHWERTYPTDESVEDSIWFLGGNAETPKNMKYDI